MALVSKYYGRRHCLLLAQAIGLLLAAYWSASTALAAHEITVILDQATITKLPERVATIVIGNPLIADVTLQAGGTMVITGKGYGVTNLVLLDRSGTVLSEQVIQVIGPQENVVVVYRGVTRESYSCAPMCERRITLGDTPEFFDATIAQIGSRNSGAQGSGGGQKPAAR